MTDIHLIPTAGLCNRMRAIASCVTIAQELQLPLTIFWNRYEGLNAKFKDLFAPVEQDFFTVIESDSWRMNINRTKDYILRRLFLTDYKQVVYNFSQQNNGDIYPLIQTGKPGKLLLISCYSMAEMFDLNRLFKPCEELQYKIDTITCGFNQHTIGVHIRRTDNKLSIKDSPVNRFISKLQGKFKSDPQANFYLATDDWEIKKNFKGIFGDRMISTDLSTSRDSIEGMKFAIVELYCLASTNQIIGSNFSSYSQIAAQIGNIPLTYASR